MALNLVSKPPTKPRRQPPPQRRVRVSALQVERARRAGRPKASYEPFRPAEFPPKAVPDDKRIAQDEAITENLSWAQSAISSAFAEGVTFMGYAALAVLAQRPEYRVISEQLAYEMTREWIELKSKSDDEDKSERIQALSDAAERLDLREAFRCAVQHDGFFGRAHIYVDTGDTDDREELATSIGEGRDVVSRAKFIAGEDGKRKRVVAFRPVEPVWVYPTRYDSTDPLKPDWYKPVTWFVMGKEVHRSRLLTFIGREVPDLLKPAYAFGGLSMSQMAKPYVDNWLRVRQAAADAAVAFSVFVLKTNLGASLEVGGDEVFERAEFFNLMRSNAGLMLVDKDSEELDNVSFSLATMDQLQAQAQEHMAAVSHTPIVKLLGIQPAGLNASSEGEIRSYYDWVRAYQEHFFRPHLQTALDLIQLSEFGEVDPDIVFEFRGLWELDEAGKAAVQQTKAATRETDIASGVVTPEEARLAAAKDPDSQYYGLDLDKEPAPAFGEEDGEGADPDGEGGGEVPARPKMQPRPSSRLATSMTSQAARFGGAVTGGFKAQDDEKITKAEAGYVPRAEESHRCAGCSMFHDGSCDLVEGRISEAGWCRHWTEKGTK